MLPIVLVLFVATSALAAPSVLINQAPISSFSVPYDTGAGYNSGLSAKLWELSDGGDSNIYILTLQQILNDLANQKDSYSQALAISQTLAALGELSAGVPGNACAAANAINQYASNPQGGRNFVSNLAAAIDSVATLAANPNGARFAQSSPSSGSCQGNGRTYQFEAAWTGILNAASPYDLPLVNEEYCATKRLYQAFNVRSNNVAAAVTAASLPPVVQTVQRHITPILNFMRAAANGNGYSQAGAAKQALLS